MNQKLKEATDKLERAQNSRRAAQKLRRAVMTHLGGPFCSHCGYNNEKALSIDHINNDGAQERKKMNHVYSIYRGILRLPENEAREHYQVLCRNCNWLKQQERIEETFQNRRRILESKIREDKEMGEHYRLLKLPFGLGF